jgi:hypothetical protein
MAAPSKPRLSKREKRLQKTPPTKPAPKTGPSALARLISSLSATAAPIVRSPVFSYAAILLLQVRAVWGMWWYRDMSTGDTAQYYQQAFSWYKKGLNSFLWSPLYTSFYGTLMHITDDAYYVTILHRMIIVLVLAVLVLALMRRLLPPGIAWMAAAWWVVLPINYNALYEVHMFAVIPLLLSVLVVLWIPGSWGRGICVGALLATGILMRNENVLAAALFAVLSLAWELFRRRSEPLNLKKLAAAYGLPILATAALSVFYFFHSVSFPFGPSLRQKHTVNVCQAFAFGYQQRASDFQGDSWYQCGDLMQRTFGAADLTMTEALWRNPKAMFEHFWWNTRLAPSGLEVLLFNYRSGAVNPDYVATDQNRLVLIPTLLTCVLLVAGLFLLIRDWPRWRPEWSEQKAWAWIAMGATGLVVFGVLVTQRPRPSYMFILGVELRVLVALCCYVVLSHWPKLRRIAVPAAIVLAAVAFLLPGAYEREPSTRPIFNAYRRVAPYASFFSTPKFVLVSNVLFVNELTSYVGNCGCPYVLYGELRTSVAPGASLGEALNNRRATFFYADEQTLADPLARDFVSNASSYDWKVLAERHSGAENWAVVAKTTSPSAGLNPP